MEPNSLLREVEEIRKSGKYKSNILCAYVNMSLRADDVEILYELFQELDEKSTAIFLRNIVKQFIKLNLPKEYLKVEKIKGNSKNEYLLRQYKSVINANRKEYYDAFSKICEI